MLLKNSHFPGKGGHVTKFWPINISKRLWESCEKFFTLLIQHQVFLSPILYNWNIDVMLRSTINTRRLKILSHHLKVMKEDIIEPRNYRATNPGQDCLFLNFLVRLKKNPLIEISSDWIFCWFQLNTYVPVRL